MIARQFLVAMAAWFLFTATAPAQVEWKFAKGQTFEFERVATQTQSVDIKGKTLKHQQSSTWHIRVEVKDKQGANFILTATLADVKHELAGATDMIDPKLHEKMKGSDFTLEVTRHGEIVKLQGHDDFLKRLAGADEAGLKAVRATFPESALQEAFADLFGPLPAKEIAWQREYVEPIPHFGQLRATAKYEHTGTKKGRDMIYYTIQTKYEPPAKDERNVIFRVVKGSIDTDKATGTIAFDSTAGQLVEHERTMLLRGKLTIEAMDRQQPLEFSSENSVKVRFKN